MYLSTENISIINDIKTGYSSEGVVTLRNKDGIVNILDIGCIKTNFGKSSDKTE